METYTLLGKCGLDRQCRYVRGDATLEEGETEKLVFTIEYPNEDNGSNTVVKWAHKSCKDEDDDAKKKAATESVVPSGCTAMIDTALHYGRVFKGNEAAKSCESIDGFNDHSLATDMELTSLDVPVDPHFSTESLLMRLDAFAVEYDLESEPSPIEVIKDIVESAIQDNKQVPSPGNSTSAWRHARMRVQSFFYRNTSNPNTVDVVLLYTGLADKCQSFDSAIHNRGVKRAFRLFMAADVNDDDAKDQTCDPRLAAFMDAQKELLLAIKSDLFQASDLVKAITSIQTTTKDSIHWNWKTKTYHFYRNCSPLSSINPSDDHAYGALLTGGRPRILYLSGEFTEKDPLVRVFYSSQAQIDAVNNADGGSYIVRPLESSL